MKDRVHFYSASDMSAGMYIERLEKVLDEYTAGRDDYCVNDVIELWHCRKFVESGRSQSWGDEKWERYKAEVKGFGADLVRFFASLKVDDFLSEFDKLDYDYQHTVFEILDVMAQDYLTEDCLRTVLDKHPHLIKIVLRGKNTVRRFDSFLNDYLKHYTNTAELLLSQYAEQSSIHDREDIIFPKSLSLDDREACVVNYLDRKGANSNYVSLALLCKDSDGLRLSPETRLKAKKVQKQLTDEIFSDENSLMPVKMTVAVEGETYNSKKPVEIVNDDDADGFGMTVHVSKEFLNECDYKDLLFSFSIYFGWSNPQGYSSLVSNPVNMSIFEKIGMHGKNSYPTGLTYRTINNLALLEVLSVQTVLKDKGRSLEEGLKFFYEQYLPKRYGYPSLVISIPPVDADYVTKLRTLLPEMDAIVKHYDVYVKHGEIDPELIALSKPLPVTKGRSLLEKRNIYATSDKTCEIYGICNLLFSDQTLLDHIEPYKDKHYGTFYDLMINEETVNYDMYEQYQKPKIDYLLDKKLIKLDGDKNIKFADNNLLFIYLNLWQDQVLSYWSSPETIRKELDELLAKGWVESDDYLLCRQEREWFSYYLNNEMFTNGPAIRNLMEHGANTTFNEKQLQQMYATSIVLFISLLLKINYDLLLAEMVFMLSQNNSRNDMN